VNARCGANIDRRETPATIRKAAALTAPQSRPPNNDLEIKQSGTLSSNANMHSLTILLRVISVHATSAQ